ncbi:hypothetical protein TEPIDINF_002973 [Tepidibacillus infernus]|uniref:hypothetical protein n=1 Tax=Tepidibacillus infernus TaxID=1806172 RepID=UPI003A2B3555
MKKSVIIAIVILVVIVLLQISTILPKTVATISTSLYVNIKYNDLDLQYQYVEFDTHFGDYFVTYKDKNGKKISFTVTPKLFPVYILYDPLDAPMK